LIKEKHIDENGIPFEIWILDPEQEVNILIDPEKIKRLESLFSLIEE
jgi:hypothetical protein